MKKVIILIIITLIGNSLNGFVNNENSIRGMGMGNAYVGISDDITAIYYNSSGLWKMRFVEAMAGYSSELSTEGLYNMNVNFGPINILDILYAGFGGEIFNVNDILQINTFVSGISIATSG
jgi:hypothetical protein